MAEKTEVVSALSFYGDFKEKVLKGEPPRLISTGFPTLDGCLQGGLRTGAIYTLGGLTGAGKTAFAMQTADNIAAAGHDVLIFTLEMSITQLMARSLSRISSDYDGQYYPSYSRILGGAKALKEDNGLYDVPPEALERYQNSIAPHLYFIEDVYPDGSVKAICAAAEDFAREHPNPVIVIDYLQFIQAPRGAEQSEYKKVNEVMKALKKMCRKLQAPIILVSSINRDNYRSVIGLESFKDSGMIEYTSDVILGLDFLDKEELATDKDGKVSKQRFNDMQSESLKSMSMKILKNRFGAPTQCVFVFEGAKLKFTDNTIVNR